MTDYKLLHFILFSFEDVREDNPWLVEVRNNCSDLDLVKSATMVRGGLHRTLLLQIICHYG